MSYTRRFSKQIAVRYSGTVSYPASQSGGVKSYSGTAYETVYFNVHVDTDPFDDKVDSMKHHVDLLTSSVVATKTAHVAVKEETSKQVGDTIVKGFYKAVQSDISQQVTELKNNTDALLIQLNKLAAQCNDKRRQMGVDYQRLASRYTKIFEDLNQELENRIYSIDEPIFHTTRLTDKAALKGTVTDMVGTASIAAGENVRTASKITASVIKRRALDAIRKGKLFLDVQYRTDALLDSCLRQGGEHIQYAAPYCVFEAASDESYSTTNVFTSPLLDDRDKETLTGDINSLKWEKQIPERQCAAIADYFHAEVATKMRATADDEHKRRVADMTARLFNLSSTATTGE